jgi:hypothetical protein
MTDFFREISEDVRRDRVIRIWTKYQYWLIALALLIVAGTAAWRANVNFREAAAEAAGSQYEAALQLSHEKKSVEAEAAFEAIAKTAPKGYASLARLRAADEIASRDPDLAIKAYDALAADPAYDQAFRDLARLRAAMLAVDRSEPRDVEPRLSLLSAQSFPYHNTIRELLGLSALKRSDFEAAGRWFEAILSDQQASPALRQRAEAFLGLVQAGPLSIEKSPPEKSPPETAPPQAAPAGAAPSK